MNQHSKFILTWASLALLLVMMGAGYLAFMKRHDIFRAWQRSSLPAAVEYHPVSSSPQLPIAATVAASPSPAVLGTTEEVLPNGTLASEINLAVPFTPQAPDAKWDPPYKEFCEEASILMAASYVQSKAIPSADFADQAMWAIKAFEENRFGYYEDTTAEETAVVLREYFKIDSVTLLENPSVDELKRALSAGKLVLLPAAGRLLGNPYYTAPGPLYHMLVIKGYTAEGKFITNDPGTRRGADFLYSPETLMNAMHDWRADRDVTQGRKVVIIVG